MKMNEKLKILILDDEKQFTEELHEFFEKSGFDAYEANSHKKAVSILNKKAIDLLILDIRLPGINGLDVLKEVIVKYPSMEVIMVSGHGDMDTVIKAMRLGAIDYLRKPFRHIDILIAIERTQRFMMLQREIKQLEAKNSLISGSLEKSIERHFIGVSPQIKDVLDMAMTAANFPDTNVLITGESGTGKENIARIIHYASKRKNNIFCTVNSSAISDSLAESEFFGHKKGSFTGAIVDKKGFFEISDQGTLFLDEISDMPMVIQAKMLRVIEEKSITPVGETNPVHVDFRIISATNHDLQKLQDEKKFRLDLFHRLNTLHIHIPPLREHTEDIEPLLHFFIDELSEKLNKPAPGFEKEVLRALKDYHFPGNIRELKNLIERAIILSKGHTLGVRDFPLYHNQTLKQELSVESQLLNLEENEEMLIRKALLRFDNNQIAAANALGIQRMALSRKMKKHNIAISKQQ